MVGARIALLTLFFLGLGARALPHPVWAQSQPSMDVFAGYSMLPADGDDFPRQTSHGLQVSVAGHFNRWFGVFGDIGAQFDRSKDPGPRCQGRVANVTVRQLLVGPRFTARFERVDVFGHGLFGVATGDAGPDFSGFSDSGLTFGGGGGIDVRASRRFAVRVQYRSHRQLCGHRRGQLEVRRRRGFSESADDDDAAASRQRVPT